MELMEAIEKRKSVRAYLDRKVDRVLIDQMIEAALLAPTWKNSQTGRYHVVMSHELLTRVKQEGLAPFNAINSNNAPVLIVTSFVKNYSGYEKDGRPSNELGNGWGCYDLGLQNEHLLLKASELGLATLVMGIRDEKKLRDILKIDEAETIVSVIAVGYSDMELDRVKRKKVKDVATFY